MKHKNRFLIWLINKLVERHNQSSYKKIVVFENPEPVVLREDLEVVREAIDEWFDNDIERVMLAVRTFLNQDPPWFHSY